MVENELKSSLLKSRDGSKSAPPFNDEAEQAEQVCQRYMFELEDGVHQTSFLVPSTNLMNKHPLSPVTSFITVPCSNHTPSIFNCCSPYLLTTILLAHPMFHLSLSNHTSSTFNCCSPYLQIPPISRYLFQTILLANSIAFHKDLP